MPPDTKPFAVPALLYALRWLPHSTKGKTRIAHWLIAHALADRPASIRVGSLQFQVPSSREPIAMHLIANASYEPGLCTALQRVLRPDSVFLDVGANVGVFAIQAAHHWCPNGKVLAFEASPRIHAYLARNASLNPHPALTLLNNAVSSSTGTELIFYDAPVSKFGMGSLINRFNTEGTRVSTLTLDDAVKTNNLPQVDAIKVDVEGFELDVFRGATRVLSQSRPPVIFFEFNDWAESRPEQGVRAGDAQRFLLASGYSLQTLPDYLSGRSPGTQVIETGSTDLVALPRPL